jgi:hypothetical protein
MINQDTLNAIKAERQYQIQKWGASDSLNTEYNWAAYIGAYTNRSLIGFPGLDEARKAAFRKDMIKVATLAIAAAESV